MLIPQALRIVALDLDGTLLRSDSTIVTHSGSNFVEVAAAGVTKALALAQYCEEAGITAAQVIAFGDMPNDLPMLQWAGHSVAVANAHPEVLAVAQLHTASNDDDGVAQTLEQLTCDTMTR